MQVCDHDSETIIMISDRRSDACQQFLDMWHLRVALGLSLRIALAALLYLSISFFIEKNCQRFHLA